MDLVDRRQSRFSSDSAIAIDQTKHVLDGSHLQISMAGFQRKGDSLDMGNPLRMIQHHVRVR